MQSRMPERHKKPGVSYAFTDDGVEIPVIDVSHPAFGISPTDDELSALSEAFSQMVERSKLVTSDEQRLAMRQQMDSSILGRGLMAGMGTFLTGMNTYLMKLGPDNLGEYANDLDRQIASSLPMVSMRMRIQDMARLQADSLAPALAAHGHRPLHFINIAGGPAIDSLNALILLRRARPALLDGRAIAIHVFDQDRTGPSFGMRALDALRADGAMLQGLDITFGLVPYDWRQAQQLTDTLAALDLPNAIWAASSEGGLFEYGSDDDVVANLRALREGKSGGSFTASVTREDGPGTISRGQTGLAVVPRSLAAVTDLAQRGGWALDEAITTPFSFNIHLK